jgi:hypothetical protein
MKDLIIIIAIILVGLFLIDILYPICAKRESFDSNELTLKKKSDLADIIINFINENTSFDDYSEFMKTTSNTYNHLLTADTFYEFKFLKRNDRLTKDNVMSKMIN